MSAVIMVAALTSANATAITGARTGYALARTFPAFGWPSRWDDRRGTPVNAFIVQGVIALLLVIGGSFSRDGFRSEEHTSELQSLMRNSYAGFCLKTKKHTHNDTTYTPS